MRTIDDVTSKLNGANHFSVLDVTHAYWSIKLDTKSFYLTTFSTPFGRYRYLRMPFGLNCSQDIWQTTIDETFEGLTGVACVVDDILIWERTKSEHDSNLLALLDRARGKGVRFNPEKLLIDVKEVPFFGHVITDTGLKVDSEKVKAITSLQYPKSKAELETVLGMVNYLQKISPHLADITISLRALLKKDVEFVFDQPQIDVSIK